VMYSGVFFCRVWCGGGGGGVYEVCCFCVIGVVGYVLDAVGFKGCNGLSRREAGRV